MTGNRFAFDEISPTARIATERVALELRKVGVTLAVNAMLQRQDDLGFLDQLTYRLSSYVLSDHLVSDTATAHAEYETPASWWQAWKQANLDYLLRRFPVRTEKHSVPVEVRFDRYATYPRANIALPEDRLGAPVVFETFEQTR